jgi:hypothetical protein
MPHWQDFAGFCYPLGLPPMICPRKSRGHVVSHFCCVRGKNANENCGMVKIQRVMVNEG